MMAVLLLLPALAALLPSPAGRLEVRGTPRRQSQPLASERPRPSPRQPDRRAKAAEGASARKERSSQATAPVEREGRRRGHSHSGREARRRLLRAQCAAIRASEWKQANETLRHLSEWSPGEYRAMLQAASQVSNWRGALQIIDHMEASGDGRPPTAARRAPPVDVAAFGHAIAACARAGEAEQGEQLLQRMRTRGAWPEVRSYNMVITCYAKKGRWRHGLRILDDMRAAAARASGPAPNVVSCNAALAGCSRARRWEEALALLDRMHKEGPPPDVVSFSTAATACQRAEQWEPALRLLEVVNDTDAAAATAALALAPPLVPVADGAPLGAELPRPKSPPLPRVQPNAFTYTASVTALAGAGKWREALETYDRIPAAVERNEAMLNAAVGAAAAGNDWRRGVQLLDDAIQSGLTPRASSFNMALQMPAVLQRPSVALTILRKMRSAEAPPNLLTYNSALRAMANGGRWRQALRLLSEMQSHRVAPTLVSYNLALAACAKAGEGKTAFSILSQVVQNGMKPDVVTYSSAIAALSKEGDMEAVVGLIGAIDANGESGELNSFSWSSAIAACERGGEWQKGVALFHGLRQAMRPAEAEAPHSQLSEAVYNAAISAAGSGGNVQEALALLDDMETAGLQPNLRSFNACLKACERAADWDTAIDLFGRIKASGAKPDQISYTSVVGALGRGGEWALAMSMWTQMELEGIAPDGLALHTLMLALSRNGQWQAALRLFDGALSTEMPAARTTVAFAAAISACAEGEQARRATDLLELMPKLNMLPSPACYLAASKACANAGEWRAALAVWQQMLRNDMRPAPAMWQVVLKACRDAGDEAEEETQMLLEFAEREGVPLMALEESDCD
ncbi:hypothetical protein AB1Y20_000474 [Prymnesium parvum]|uniref:PROP1-like PPR domain-containing protein n=1 Tax=Prymnesium parvum TaxID=97485 RepID=A0AB34K505_PRYPA